MTEEFDDFDSENEVAPERSQKRKKRKPVLPMSDYSVGYGRPPAQHRFKKGQSGNPRGRPRGALNKPATTLERFKKMFKREMDRKITVQTNDGPARMSLANLILRTILNKAAKGNVRAATWSASMNLQMENDEKRHHEELAQAALEYKWYWSNEISSGACPEHRVPLPHPDDVHVDRHGNAEFRGPVTPEELERDRKLESEREKWEEQLVEIENDLVACEAKRSDRRFNQKRLRLKIEDLKRDKALLIDLLRRTTKQARYGG